MPTILIVDDVIENIAVIGRALADDYEVRFATNGPQALEAVESGSISLILLDIDMPGMDGYEVCRRLKSQETTRGIPIIFLTARTEVEDEARGLALGAVDYITKPFNLPIVQARVRTHLELKARQEAMLSFLQIASHDLKNPLTLIRISSVLLEQCPDDVPHYARIINRAVDRASALIDTYLLASSVTSGALKIQPEIIQVKELVEGELRFARNALKSANQLTFANRCRDLTISADRLKLSQILGNLISNAAKYSPEGGEVSVEVESFEGEVLFKISDQGVGISAEERERLFKQFQRVGDQHLTSGTGLGLWLTRVLIQAHGGKIWVQSAPGEGSVFFFTLPLTPNIEAGEGVSEPAEELSDCRA